MEPSYDHAGILLKVKGKFGYGRCVCLTKWNDDVYLHINDDSKCWSNGKFDQTKAKSISMKWTDALMLKQYLMELDSYVKDFENNKYLKTTTNHLELGDRLDQKPSIEENPPINTYYTNQGTLRPVNGLNQIPTQTSYRYQPYSGNH